MITSSQLKAARALLEIDQKMLSDLSGVSLATIRRMESSAGTVRGNVDTLVKVIEALKQQGLQLVDEDAESLEGGRGVRLMSRQ